MTELARLQLMEMNIALLLSRNEVVIKNPDLKPLTGLGVARRDCHGLRLCNDSRARNDTSLSF